MSTATHYTAAELLQLPSNGKRCELIRGELKMMSPAGWEHGRIAGRIMAFLFQFVHERNLGAVLAAETGFLIEQDPDTIRAPDAAFVAKARIEQNEPVAGFWRGAPDLAVEVISPSESYVQVDQKVTQWLEAGCRIVWVINPRRQTVQVFDQQTPKQINVLNAADTITGGEVLPGFELQVEKLFTS